MTHFLPKKVLPAICLVTVLSARLFAAEPPVLEIGTSDKNNLEFALAPKDFRQFKDDGFFVTGLSSSAKDWPYVHPGPDDAWAGSRSHTFTILFGLKAPPRALGRLMIAALDSHSGSPPRLQVSVNGHHYEKAMPRGRGDESISGNLANTHASTWEIALASDVLRAGENEITLTTLSGSWFLYDSIRLEALGAELVPVANGTRLVSVTVPPVWLKSGDQAVQPVDIVVRHVGVESIATLQIGELEPRKLSLLNGLQHVELRTPAEEQQRTLPLKLSRSGIVLSSTNLSLSPPRIRQMWLLPHSHVDIGYTHRQDEVIKVQIGNLEKAMDLARGSAQKPAGMRFKWNPEAVWSLDHFLEQASPQKRQQFLEAVRNGDVGVDALYGNMLTGLCRPEELAQGVGFGARLSNLTGRPVLSASICDVPGYTWGIVPIMAQAGVKYFAIGPNFGDRVGTIHVWDDKPFYWKSQSGRDRVLCWVVDNYHHLGNLEENVRAQIDRLGRTGFPYDVSFIFWVGKWPDGGVDNAPPDEQLVEKVVAWNDKYAAPRVTIGLASEFFKEFERRGGARVPEYSGDLTPYWEDGAGSTSRETAMNRASGDRLSQASALFAMRQPKLYPVEQFDRAWKDALLYSEHTWGAWCSISKPDDPFTLDQWKVKQGFALEADKQSRALLTASLGGSEKQGKSIDVYNTTQWPRTDLAAVPRELVKPGGVGIVDAKGKPVPSQCLASGELVFLAKEIPPFGASRFSVTGEPYTTGGGARASGCALETRTLQIKLDEKSGSISSLRLAGQSQDFVAANSDLGLNGFRYVLGTNAESAKANGPVSISVLESGPLVASLRIESKAPGCNKLERIVRVVDGLDRVELINQVDRQSVREKDGVHFGFDLNVPGATLRMETPWAVVRPNVDQLPGSCRNWFTVQRWVDVSSADRGILWASLDAPLMEIGGLTANLLGSVNSNEWLTNAIRSEKIYSWAQNNHWHTNYKIDQPGVTSFRYYLYPHHGGYSASASARFGVETTRPLVVAPAGPEKHAAESLFAISTPDVLVETVKPSEDRQALILRLFGVSGQNRSVRIHWKSLKPAALWKSDLTERPLTWTGSGVEVPGYDVVILRADLPGK